MKAAVVVKPGTIAIDYSSARPSPTVLVAAGVGYVQRYLADPDVPKQRSKILGAEELDALLGHGITVGLNYEESEGDFESGFEGGKQRGARAAAQLDKLGWPTSVPIYASIDTNITVNTLATARDYVRGFASTASRPVGVYGDSDMIEAWAEFSDVPGWQSNSSSFSSGLAPHTGLKQLVIDNHNHWHTPALDQFGKNIDENIVLKPLLACGTTTTEENDMAAVILAPRGANARFLATEDNHGTVTSATWIPDETRFNELKANGVRVKDIEPHDLHLVPLIGPLPKGDTLFTWTPQHFMLG